MSKLSAKRYVACGHACKCRFCDKCCLAYGLALREKLKVAFGTWQNLQMWTLTIDPNRFESPIAAFRYVMDKKLLARLMRDLRKTGDLTGNHYFWVLECHRTGWPHWHLVIDTPYMHHKTFSSIWNRLGTGKAGINFGFVSYSRGSKQVNGKPRFQSRIHAANYICKYITKPPEAGWPEWIMDYTGNIKRSHASHGMFNEVAAESVEKKPVENPRGSYEKKNSVRVRVRDCGSYTTVFAQLDNGSWMRLAYCPTSVNQLQSYFCIEGLNWEIPPPGVDIHIDMLIWSWAGRSDKPKCSLDENGQLQVDPWDVDKYLDISQDLPEPWLSELTPCG